MLHDALASCCATLNGYPGDLELKYSLNSRPGTQSKPEQNQTAEKRKGGDNKWQQE